MGRMDETRLGLQGSLMRRLGSIEMRVWVRVAGRGLGGRGGAGESRLT